MPFQCHVPICSPISYALLVIYIFNMQIEKHSCTSEACPWHPRSLLEAYLCILTKSESLWGHSSGLAVFYKLRLFPLPIYFFCITDVCTTIVQVSFLWTSVMQPIIKKKEKHNLNISTTLPLSLPRDLRPIYIAVECEDTVTYSIYIILKLTVNVLEALNKFYDFFSPQLFYPWKQTRAIELLCFVLFCFCLVGFYSIILNNH